MDFELAESSSIDVRRQYNIDLPIHTLPAELFINILLLTTENIMDGFPTARLHILAQVCTYWFHSVLTNPRFWRIIDHHDPIPIPTILHRNPSGPLMVRSDEHVIEDTNDFLDRICDHTSRWETLILGIGVDETTMNILRRPMPALKALQMWAPETENEAPVFPAFEAPGLEVIALTSISMPWNTASLSGLKYLSLYNLKTLSPSLYQLVTILIASPALEWLHLGELGPVVDEDEDDDDIDVDICNLTTKIELQELRGLILGEQIPRSMLSYLASRVTAPQCHTFQVSIPFDLINHPESTFGELAKPPINPSELHTSVRYLSDTISVSVSWTSEQFHAGRWGFEEEEADTEIVVHVSYDLHKWSILAKVLALPQPDSEISLYYLAGPRNQHGQPVIRAHHLAFWKSAHGIAFNSPYFDVIAALRSLRTATVVNGQECWPCPKLKNITISRSHNSPLEAQAIGALLTEMVEERYLAWTETDQQGELLDGTAPVPFGRLRAEYDIIKIVQNSRSTEGLRLDSID